STRHIKNINIILKVVSHNIVHIQTLLPGLFSNSYYCLFYNINRQKSLFSEWKTGRRRLLMIA
ncbi:hypothetical protein ACUNGW_10800, partial [Serratia sp. IR-2025]